MPYSRFNKEAPITPAGNRLAGETLTALAGLDQVTPTESLKDGRTPEAKNFRLYAQSEGGREVAVSTRKGPGFYVEPLTEALKQSQTTLSSTLVLSSNNIVAERKAVSFTGYITKLELNLQSLNGTGPLRVDIYSDNSNKPGVLLAESSFTTIPTDGWATCRFLNSVQVTSGSYIWLVIYQQDDCTGNYSISTSSTGSAFFSYSSILGLTAQTYGIPYKLYGCDGLKDKGGYRFNRESGDNITLVPFGSSMYIVDESTHTFKLLMSGLSSSATEYSFTNGDGSIFWANGFDDGIYKWTGVHEDTVSNMVSNPSFTTDTSGWAATGGGTGNAIARVTSPFNTAPASLNVTATSGDRSARTTLALTKGKRYRIKYSAQGAGTTYIYANGPNTSIGPSIALTGSWQDFDFYYIPTADVTSLDFKSTGNFFIDDVSIIDTNIEKITDTELPTVSQIAFHKDRIIAFTANDPNKIVFSENPGNPSNNPVNKQWYREWLSVSFIYAPRPMNGSPITRIISFQDALTVLTQDKKYIISGSDRGNYYMRESTGSKGAISRKGVTYDPNYIYFVGDDGIYKFNGSKDEKISVLIQPLFDKCPRKRDITLALWNNQLRVYMASEQSSVNDICAIYDLNFNEWMLDTDTFCNRAIYYADADDDGELIEFNSKTGALHKAEQDYNALGGPIDFDYRLKYNSFGTPAQRKKIKRFFPLLQAVGSSFTITHGIDRDMADSPRTKTQELITGGHQLGTFQLDGSVILSGKVTFKPKKVTVSGNARTFQYRVSRNAVNNQVAFMGVQLTYKTKRL